MRGAPKDRQRAQDALENEITKTFALLEMMAVLRLPVLHDEFIPLDMVTLEGLYMLGKEHGTNLKLRFEELLSSLAAERKAAGR